MVSPKDYSTRYRH
ncbi:hypothetical protein AZE42_13612 [Rhizopogon vesiculosus]|uniref:Uncharacterized protein n=1 Tax=Rhizopogon vesiculosus TaxID=180088 RepID=A0A1J8R5C7_9AGAM|nr:hypothetical protein AZE42_13612 [Rhizopogon vesiculosus]